MNNDLEVEMTQAVSRPFVPLSPAALVIEAEQRDRGEHHRCFAVHHLHGRRVRWLGLMLIGTVLSWAASHDGALAQAAAPAPQSTADPSGQLAPGTRAPNTDIARKSGTLSDKLDAQNGVIHPRRNVDPGMRKPAPRTGAMTVIRPPGSPGAPTAVQPK